METRASSVLWFLQLERRARARASEISRIPAYAESNQSLSGAVDCDGRPRDIPGWRRRRVRRLHWPDADIDDRGEFDTDSDEHADCDAHGDRDQYAYRDEHGDADRNEHADANADGYEHRNFDVYRDDDGYTHRDVDTHDTDRDVYGLSDSYLHGHADVDADQHTPGHEHVCRHPGGRNGDAPGRRHRRRHYASAHRVRHTDGQQRCVVDRSGDRSARPRIDRRRSRLAQARVTG
jgi:hypothetical protein